jgi:hypothetical protein
MKRRGFALLAAFAFAQLASAAEEPVPQLSIESQRERLHAMQAELYRLEDVFFDQYNKVNDAYNYKVRCGWELEQGHRFHLCRPAFQTWAERDSVVDFTTHGGILVSPYLVVATRQRDYQKHLVQVVEQNPELLKVLQQRAELARNFVALRAKLHEETVFTFD